MYLNLKSICHFNRALFINGAGKDLTGLRHAWIELWIYDPCHTWAGYGSIYWSRVGSRYALVWPFSSACKQWSGPMHEIVGLGLLESSSVL